MTPEFPNQSYCILLNAHLVDSKYLTQLPLSQAGVQH